VNFLLSSPGPVLPDPRPGGSVPYRPVNVNTAGSSVSNSNTAIAHHSSARLPASTLRPSRPAASIFSPEQRPSTPQAAATAVATSVTAAARTIASASPTVGVGAHHEASVGLRPTGIPENLKSTSRDNGWSSGMQEIRWEECP
jgi:hypothetical protein